MQASIALLPMLAICEHIYLIHKLKIEMGCFRNVFQWVPAASPFTRHDMSTRIFS